MNMKIDSKDEINSYSQAAYSWLMLITNYYKRVNELDLNIDNRDPEKYFLISSSGILVNSLYDFSFSELILYSQ